MPTRPMLHERVDPEPPDAARADREVDLLVRLELGRLAVVHQRARELDVCCGVSGTLDTGVTLPSILKAGGNSAVRNRSEPLLG